MPIAGKARLAVAALLELAQEPGHQPLPMISARLRVSVSCLELLLSRLRRGGLVRSTRGPGASIASPEQITVQEVDAAVRAGDQPTRDGAEKGKQPGGVRMASAGTNSSSRRCVSCRRFRCAASSIPTDVADGRMMLPT